MAAGNFKEAAKSFEEVERQHPYSQWATRGQIMAAYPTTNPTSTKMPSAAAERFIELHPGHKDVAYAYYLMGMSYYEQISDVGRDQEMTQKSQESFNELIRRFPDSDYSQDATAQGRSDPGPSRRQGDGDRPLLSAAQSSGSPRINRFQAVVENYQTTTHVPEALHRLTESYLALGMTAGGAGLGGRAGLQFPGQRMV